MQANKNHDTSLQKQNFIACPSCTFGFNETNEQTCRICSEPLKSTPKVAKPEAVTRAINFEDKLHAQNDRAKKDKTKKGSVKRKSKKYLQLSQLKKSANLFIKLILKTTTKISSHKQVKEIKQPSTLIGLAILGLALSLWLSTLWSSEGQSDVAKNIEQSNQEQTIEKTFPNGIFNYGGSPLFAPLVSNGLNAEIEAKNPGTELRFSKPLDDDHSSQKGVERLLGEQLSFAFNTRSLTDSEYKSAQLRNVKLQQAPIGTDGIVFFGNNNDSVSGLNKNQVRDIYEGRISNWNEINAQAPDMPIILVLSNEEEVEALGIDPVLIPDSAKYVTNYTQSIREVIGTPGAISFASASLVKGQQLVDFLDLAEGDSGSYVSPFIGGDSEKPNLEAFKNETYPATRTIFVNYRDDNTLDYKTGISYVNFLNSPPGQKIIEVSGIVPWGRSR